MACWAHARRKFFDARSSSPAEASLILEMIRRLYEVEDRARPLDDAARCELRQAEAVPILERLKRNWIGWRRSYCPSQPWRRRSLATTNVYAEVDLEMKAQALAGCEVGDPGPGKPWRADAGLIGFHRSL